MRGYSLLLAFDRDDEAFAYGVEVGSLYERARSEPGEFSQIVHACNAEMVLRIAEAAGRSVRSDDLDSTWMEVTFDAAE